MDRRQPTIAVTEEERAKAREQCSAWWEQANAILSPKDRVKIVVDVANVTVTDNVVNKVTIDELLGAVALVEFLDGFVQAVRAGDSSVSREQEVSVKMVPMKMLMLMARSIGHYAVRGGRGGKRCCDVHLTM